MLLLLLPVGLLAVLWLLSGVLLVCMSTTGLALDDDGVTHDDDDDVGVDAVGVV